MNPARSGNSSAVTPPALPPGGVAAHALWHNEVISGSQTVLQSPRRSPVSASDATAPPLGENSQLCLTLFPSPNLAAGEVPADVSGITIGHFRLVRRLGSGGMGAVFLATDERLKRPVAVKVLSPQQAREPSAIQRFQNEASATARLSHDHVANVHYAGEDRGLHFIAFEFVEGLTLRDLIRQRGRLEVPEAIHLTLQIATALSHLASHGVVHRDIKPSNIIISPSGQAKLIDLGLARQEQSDSSQELTVAGTTLGTFDYISPEQAKDPRKADIRSDIYSLGCTLFHMLVGEPPYPEGTVLQKLLDHQARETPDPATRNRQIPRGVSIIVRRMMESDPKRRYQTAELLIQDLVVAARAMGINFRTAAAVIHRWSDLGKQGAWTRNASWLAATACLLAIVGWLQWYVDSTTTTSPNTPTFGQVSPTLSAPPSPPEKSTPSFPPSVQTAAVDATTATPNKALNPLEGNGTPLNSAEELPRVFDKNMIERLTNLLNPGLVPQVPAPPEPSPERLATNTPSRKPVDSIGDGSPLASRPVVSPELPSKTEPPKKIESPKKTEPLPTSAMSSDARISLDGGGAYPFLEAACAAANDYGTIELKYDGLWMTAERPIRINGGKHLTIRGATGYRPVVRFDGSQLSEEGRMISIMGGALTLINVEVQFVIPSRFSTQPWALFALENVEKLDLQNCVITATNSRSHSAASIVELIAGPGQILGALGNMNKTSTTAGIATEVSIKNCLLRAGTDGITARDGLPFRLNIDNSLVAFQGNFLKIPGRQEVMADSGRAEVTLQHSTFLLGGSLIQAQAAEESVRAMSIAVTAYDNIISSSTVSLGRQPALIETGDQPMMRDAVTWIGERNFYDAIDVFWVTRSPNSLAESKLDFSEWQRNWGAGEAQHSQNAAIPWQRGWRQTAWDELTPTHAALDPTNDLPAGIGGARDGGDAGAPLSLLPVPHKLRQ